MPALQLPDSLITSDWLQQQLDHPQLVLFDASWHMPGAERDAYQEWQALRIKGSRFFDFDQSICDKTSTLPHMLPSAEQFSEQLQQLGLNNDSVVVIYDSLGMITSPRVWWMLRTMNFANCAILDGGLPAWQAAGYELLRDTPGDDYQVGNFIAGLIEANVSDYAAVLGALADDSKLVVDARPVPRFNGEVDEPRPGLRKGHMPGAANLPFAGFFENGLLKPKPELQALLAPHFASDKHTICSCGSGVTACILAFAAHLCDYQQVSVYDGSWSEWGLPGDLPVVCEAE